MNTVFDIEQKQDTPEKLAAAAGKPTKNFLFANEFNDVARKAVESAVENCGLRLFWSNNPAARYKVGGIDSVQKLKVTLDEDWIIKNTDAVYILIDRYRPKRKVRTGGSKPDSWSFSGFKHDIFPNPAHPERPSEIRIFEKSTFLDFKPENYFNPIANWDGGFLPIGIGERFSRKGKKAFAILQFRLRVVKANKVFESTPKAVFKVNMKQYPKKGWEAIDKTKISYQLL
jgi:hypothetical protein